MLTVQLHEACERRERFLAGGELENGEAAEHFLGFGERPVRADFLFLDAAGQPAWAEEIEKPVLARLRAKKLQQTYVVLPFNWHTINYEHLLCNMWFVGKTVYPDAFADVDVEQKCREIFTLFYGRDIYDELKATYQPFEKPKPDARQ